jgi:hypothetical protein
LDVWEGLIASKLGSYIDDVQQLVVILLKQLSKRRHIASY